MPGRTRATDTHHAHAQGGRPRCRPLPIASGIKMLPHKVLARVDKDASTGALTAIFASAVGPEEATGPFDAVVVAVGRRPNTYSLGLDAAGVKTGARALREGGGGKIGRAQKLGERRPRQR